MATYAESDFYRHLEALVNASPSFVAIASLDGQVLFVNDFGRQLIGIPRDVDVTLTTIIDYLTPEGIEQSLNIEQPAVKRDGFFQGTTTLKDWRTGEGIPVDVTSLLLRDASNDEPMVLATIQRDIRERLRNEETIMTLRRQREVADRLESLGRLAAGVAHDFNNLLNVMMNCAELLLRRASDDTVRADLEVIQTTALRGADLTRQLLAFARQDPTPYVEVDLNEIVVEACSFLERTLGRKISLRQSLSPQPLMISANRSQIMQIIMNLALNARDAMPDGGTLSLTTSAGVMGASGEGYVELTVGDTGMGMSPEVIAHAFEPFFTTKPRESGTGLGLATVYGIIQQMCGEIDVTSTEGVGTVFRMRFSAETEVGSK